MKALTIDLSAEKMEWAEINEESVRYYLGGRGLGARYLYDHLAPGTDGLSPDNILTFWASPLIGTSSMSTVKLCGVTKSPTTGTILMSLMGGQFGTRFRFAGMGGLVLKGEAKSPVYLLVKDGQASLQDAGHLWGKTTSETERILREELSLRDAEIASIGPAGEKHVAFAAIMSGGNAMGRGGIGAVMGSKLLKAIVVSGSERPTIADPQRFKEIMKRIGAFYRDSAGIQLYGATGTPGHVDEVNMGRFFPTRNYQTNRFEEYEEVNADALYSQYVTRRMTCGSCTVKCRREAEVKEGEYAGVRTEGPEYESLWALSGNCGNASLEAVLAANQLCAEYGMDTISTGATVAFAMECFERGLLSTDDTDGIELTFGSDRALVAMVEKIGKREGIGDLLAHGTRRAAEIIGKGADYYAMQVKGLEMAAYDPRTIKGMGLNYATSPRGACQERGFPPKETWGRPVYVDRYAYDGKAELIIEGQQETAVKDAVGFCVLSSVGMGVADLAELFSAVTGWEKSMDDMMEDADRIWNLERLFNMREGFTRKDDSLPRRMLEEGVPGRGDELHVVDLERMLNDFYPARGWDQEARPLPDTLERLGLGERQPGTPVLK